MGIDGTYGFVYCGNRGLGIGVFLVEGQRIEGRDFAGGRYMGAAVQDGKGNIQLDVQIQVPAGVAAQGTASQDLPHTRHEPQMVEFAGPVTVMVKRVADKNAAIAKSGFTPETRRAWAGSSPAETEGGRSI